MTTYHGSFLYPLCDHNLLLIEVRVSPNENQASTVLTNRCIQAGAGLGGWVKSDVKHAVNL